MIDSFSGGGGGRAVARKNNIRSLKDTSGARLERDVVITIAETGLTVERGGIVDKEGGKHCRGCRRASNDVVYVHCCEHGGRDGLRLRRADGMRGRIREVAWGT